MIKVFRQTMVGEMLARLSMWGICAIILGVACCACSTRSGHSTFRLKMSSSSMAPTIQPGEFVLGDSLESGDISIKRYDVILFQPPVYSNHVFAMRVVGLPGESLRFREGSFRVNGEEVPTAGLPSVLQGQNWLAVLPMRNELSISLETNQFFVVGDNLSGASDSRLWGALERSAIIGVVQAIESANGKRRPVSFP